ncbi:MAG: hypothetical protein AAF772_04355 [Acidobacteriota bacterium]
MSELKITIDDLEIEPLSDADLAKVTGANVGGDPSCSCRRCSCSTRDCSQAGGGDIDFDPRLEL